ncbi:hypothetical protein [Actinomyces urogenitalis]|uniref:hypothetical protein n=1 Tax=Actinomyces urogenitalis TaxID=103621 RepID=UPI00242ABF11|nr:hypothetical protein [Actinomyces urogenitalis]MCI7455905.1 hypothetical protein [Actinomyces urogenitalis]
MSSSLSRRTVLAGTSWAVPTIAIAAAAPAVAASAPSSPSCGATNTTALPRYEGQSLSLTLSTPTRTAIKKAENASAFIPATSTISVPATLTIANTGTTPLPAGTKVVFSAWKLSSSGILDKDPATLIVTAGTTPNSANESVDSLTSPTAASSQSSLATACGLEAGQEIVIELTWQRTGVSNNDLTDLQFLARIVADSRQTSYTEFQSDEVVGGANH